MSQTKAYLRCLRHGWKHVETGIFGAHVVKRLRNGRMVALLVAWDGIVSVSGN